MPEISRFLGIVIAMYYREHQPPHFHAKYGDQTAAVLSFKLTQSLIGQADEILGENTDAQIHAN